MLAFVKLLPAARDQCSFSSFFLLLLTHAHTCTHTRKHMHACTHTTHNATHTHTYTHNLQTLKAYLEISVPEVEEWVETPSLADRMRAMEFEGWLGLLEYVFSALLQHLATIEVCMYIV